MAFDPTTVVATPVEQPPAATAFDPATVVAQPAFDPATVQPQAVQEAHGQLPDQDVVDRLKRGEAVGVMPMVAAMARRTMAKGGYLDQGMSSAFEPAALVPQLPRMDAKGGTVEQVGRGLYNTAAGAINALPTAGTATAIINPLARIGVAGWMAKEALQSLPDVKQTVMDPNAQLADKVEAVAGTGLMGAGVIGLGKGSVRTAVDRVAPIADRVANRPPVIKPVETMPKFVERVKAEIDAKGVDKAMSNELQGPLTILDAALAQVDNIVQTGTIQPKELRPNFALGEAAPETAVVSKSIIEGNVRALVEAKNEVVKLRKLAEETADDATILALKRAEAKFEVARVERQVASRVSHESLFAHQEAQMVKALVGENPTPQQLADATWSVRKAIADIPEMQATVRKAPQADSLLRNMKDGKYLRAAGDAVDFMRANLFAVTSWVMDAMGGTVATVGRLPARVAADLYEGARTGTMPNTAAAIELIRRPKTPYRLPELMKKELGDTFLGEQRREFLSHRGPVDTPVRYSINWAATLAPKLKGITDTFFGNMWAASDLMASAVRDAKAKGLKGADRSKFIDSYIKDPPNYALESATNIGRQMKFNRELTKAEKIFTDNTFVKLFFDAFPRWSVQASRWAADTLGADPAFWRSVKNGTVKGREVAEFATKAATGWGGLYMVNETLYDDIDFNTMEYVREDGNRIRLSNVFPLPEALMLVAITKGERDKAIQAFKFSSLMGSQFIEQRGILSSWLQAFVSSSRSDFPEQIVQREFTDFINRIIPGQALLASIETLFRPTVQEGIGAQLPGVSSFLPTRSNPGTGEPMKPMQRVFGQDFPAIRGTPIPGATRLLGPTEQALIDHGLAVTRARRTALLDMAANDVPKELRAQFEKLLGQERKNLIEPTVTNPGWRAIPFEQRRQIITTLNSQAAQIAKSKLRLGVSEPTGLPPKPVPRNTRLLPEKLRQ